MDQNTKRKIISAVDDGDCKRLRFQAEYTEEDDDVSFLLNVDVDAFSVLQELLEPDNPPEIMVPLPEKEVFPPIKGGNVEMCGSVFSYGDSSVMASFDFSGFAPFCGGAWASEEARGGDDVERNGSNGWDNADEFDELLGRFLGEEVCEN